MPSPAQGRSGRLPSPQSREDNDVDTNHFHRPSASLSAVGEKPLRDDLRFFIAIVIAGSLLFTLASLLTVSEPVYPSGSTGLYLIGMTVAALVVGLVRSLIDGAVLLLAVSLVEQFFLLFVDGHRGFERTMKSVVYALSPGILLFWVAVLAENALVSLFLLVCFCLLTYFGIRTFHEKSIDRAAFVSLATSAVLLMYFSRWLFGQGLLWG